MNDRQQIMFGFLGGTIIAVDNGYKVFPHPKPDKIYNRLSDAKWFLAVKWCDDLSSPAGIINNTGELAFLNRVVLEIGEEKFFLRTIDSIYSLNVYLYSPIKLKLIL